VQPIFHKLLPSCGICHHRSAVLYRTPDHDLRHSVRRSAPSSMTYRGKPRLPPPILSPTLGHANPGATYWYLSRRAGTGWAGGRKARKRHLAGVAHEYARQQPCRHSSPDRPHPAMRQSQPEHGSSRIRDTLRFASLVFRVGSDTANGTRQARHRTILMRQMIGPFLGPSGGPNRKKWRATQQCAACCNSVPYPIMPPL